MVAKLGLEKKAVSHMSICIINKRHKKKVDRDSDKKGSQ